MLKNLWDCFKNNKYLLVIGFFITIITYFYEYKSFIALDKNYEYKLIFSLSNNDIFVTTSGLPLPYAFARRIDYLFPPDDFYYFSLFAIDILFWTLLLTIVFYFIKKRRQSDKFN